LVQEYLTKNGITALSWPPYSADKMIIMCCSKIKESHLQGMQVPVIRKYEAGYKNSSYGDPTKRTTEVLSAMVQPMGEYLATLS
jgi:hypothetical protein